MPKATVPPETRRFVIERAGGRCEYCQSLAAYATQSFDVDHIFPQSRGGASSPDNLAYACSGCNRHKYSRIAAIDLVEGVQVSLFHPRQHDWYEHFGWNEDYTLVMGLTAIGRATVEALQLNRTGVVNLRRLLSLVGKHPPPLTGEV
jgi:hypothetical protein